MTFIKAFASNILNVLTGVMLVSAIASWIPQVRNSKIGYYLFMVTEPLVSPVRKLLHRIPALRSFPVDLSFFITYIILQMLQSLIWSL